MRRTTACGRGGRACGGRDSCGGRFGCGVKARICAPSARGSVCNFCSSGCRACNCSGSVTVGLDCFARSEDSVVVGCVAAVGVDAALPELLVLDTGSICEDFSA